MTDIHNINSKFFEILHSNESDELKLARYYELRDYMNTLLPNEKISELAQDMMKNDLLQEFMFRIADEEDIPKVQEVKYIVINGLSKFRDSVENKENLQVKEEIQIKNSENSHQQQDILVMEQQIQYDNVEVVNTEEDIYIRCKRAMDETLLDEAYKIALEAINQQSEHTKYFDSIIKKYKYMELNLRELDSEGWARDSEKDGIKVSYKFEKGKDAASMIMETTINVNAVRVLSLVNEIDLNYLWVPFCKRTYVNKQINRSIKVCTSEMYFPLISDRETIFVGEGIDRLNVNGTIVLMSRSVHDDYDFLAENDIVIPKQSKFVRMLIHYYLFEIRPIDENTCYIRAITNADPRISMVPNSVLAFIGRKFAHCIFQKIQYYAQNFESSPFYPIYKANHVFYDWLEQKMNLYLQSQRK